MTKRMTEEEAKFCHAAWDAIPLNMRALTRKRVALGMALSEMDRARAEEERLTKDLQEKDVQLKALADALAYSGCRTERGWHTWSCHHVRASGPCLQECIEVQAALRLVGRLP